MSPTKNADDSRVRVDKWLWAARCFRTRTLAVEALDRQRISVNGVPAKPGRELHPGDRVRLALPGHPPRELLVLALSVVRGSAAVAQTLYEETAESQAARAAWVEARRLAPEPAALRADGRPTKRERRELDSAADRWQRWSASLDDA